MDAADVTNNPIESLCPSITTVSYGIASPPTCLLTYVTAMPQNQKATFEHIQWQEIFKTEKPYELFMNLPNEDGDVKRTNLVFDTVASQTIEDARGQEEKFSLDKNGFMWR